MCVHVQKRAFQWPKSNTSMNVFIKNKQLKKSYYTISMYETWSVPTQNHPVTSKLHGILLRKKCFLKSMGQLKNTNLLLINNMPNALKILFDCFFTIENEGVASFKIIYRFLVLTRYLTIYFNFRRSHIT